MAEDDVVMTLLGEITDIPIMASVRVALLERREIGMEHYGEALLFSTKIEGRKELEDEILDAIVYARYCGRLDVCRKLIQMFNEL